MTFQRKVVNICFSVLFFTTGLLYGQIPPGYYNGTEGLTGEALRSALFNIIGDHTAVSYSSIWTYFQSTDKRPDGKVWDMYSDIPGGTPAYTYTFVADQCGNYSSEGDCYNREHSFPSSWFNDEAPMRTDLFHIYPTDGFVNGKRSNYPYGEVGAGTWTSTNGSKLGTCNFPGYSATVFEPIDEYKGDFARSYFYMITCYLDKVPEWSSPMIEGDDLTPWARLMLLQWSEEDTVSEKEIDRNNTVYNFQQNRNPFIDHPEWAEAIWGNPVGINDGQRTMNNGRFWYANGIVYVRLKRACNGALQISSITGQLVESFIVNNPQEDFPVDLLPGIYILTYVDHNIKITNKVIVTHRYFK